MREFTDLGSSGIWYAVLISNIIIAFIGYLLYLRIDFKPKVDIDNRMTKHMEVKASA